MRVSSRLLVGVFFQGFTLSVSAATLPPYPNDHAKELSLAVRSDLLLDGRTMAINNYMPVNDSINGRHVSGHSRMIGTGVMQLVPNDGYARLVFKLNGNVAAQTSTYAGPATIHANSNTSVAASQGIFFDHNGFGLENPQASCRTSSLITGVSARGPIIRRIAWRRAHREKPQAEYASARSAEQKTRTSLWQQVKRQLATPNDLYRTQLLPSMQNAGLVPRIASRSSADWLTAAIGLGGSALPTTGLPPKVDDDVAIQLNLHPRLSETLGQRVLAGKTLKGEDFATFTETVYGDVPADLRIQEHREAWTATFADQRPLILAWSSGSLAPDEVALKVTFRLHGVSIKGNAAGEGVVADVSDEIVVSAAYLVDMLPTGPHFSRQGDVTIAHQQAWAPEVEDFIRAKFEALLGASVYFDGLSIPAGIGGDSFNIDRLRTLKMRTLEERGGWLAMGWGLP